VSYSLRWSTNAPFPGVDLAANATGRPNTFTLAPRQNSSVLLYTMQSASSDLAVEALASAGAAAWTLYASGSDPAPSASSKNPLPALPSSAAGNGPLLVGTALAQMFPQYAFSLTRVTTAAAGVPVNLDALTVSVAITEAPLCLPDTWCNGAFDAVAGSAAAAAGLGAGNYYFRLDDGSGSGVRPGGPFTLTIDTPNDNVCAYVGTNMTTQGVRPRRELAHSWFASACGDLSQIAVTDAGVSRAGPGLWYALITTGDGALPTKANYKIMWTQLPSGAPTTTPAPTTPPPSSSSSSDTLPGWAIALIVIGCLILIVLLVLICVPRRDRASGRPSDSRYELRISTREMETLAASPSPDHA
jgi:hypothetical protein